MLFIPSKHVSHVGDFIARKAVAVKNKVVLGEVERNGFTGNGFAIPFVGTLLTNTKKRSKLR